MLPPALNGCPKCKKSPNLVTLRYTLCLVKLYLFHGLVYNFHLESDQLQDRTTVYQENSTWSNLMLSIQSGPDELTNKDWDRASFHRQRREYHVHSHLFQNLDADSRYEVIIQSKNKFGWSEPTKSFIFSTRLRGKSTKLASKSFRVGGQL